MADFGVLDDYIVGASVKRLSDVECDPERSNQHELNGTVDMKVYLGSRGEFSCDFIRLDDTEESIERSVGKVTWYDAREAHPTRSEHRFYFPDNPAIERASAGDPIAVILKRYGGVIFVTAPEGSQSELDILELFGENISAKFKPLDLSNGGGEIGTIKRFVLQELGVELKAEFGRDYLETIEEEFGELKFPGTKVFSTLARRLSGSLKEFGSSDEAITAWWDVEEAMFYQLEAELITDKLESGFEGVEDFLSFSTTVKQRRSSRAGHALENHLAFLFAELGINHSWGARTEKNKKPDFIFPSIEDYQDLDFPCGALTMLGVKTTCKDRWRQVLTEANRIQSKHLFTLQPKISENQTEEMRDAELQLVVPQSIHSSFTKKQREWLWDFENFIDRVSKNQQ